MNTLAVLRQRGVIEQVSDEDLTEHLESGRGVYVGFDPTADSLHLGNLVALMGLAWFERLGHRAVGLVGGATGMIGDPSFRVQERSYLDLATLQKNVDGIRDNLARVLKTPTLLNNYDWFSQMHAIDFLRDVGRYFRIGPMLGKETVRLRLESHEGMSFTEFSYPLLQGYDFLYLYEQHGVTLQLGGADQWGNITAGIELIRKKLGQTAYGLTLPLLLDKEGKKFGKSAQGAIWLSSEKLSPYQFYQYLVNVADEDVIKLLRLLTFLELEEIDAVEAVSKERPGQAQRLLAAEVTRLIHGQEGLDAALHTTQLLQPGQKLVLTEERLEALAKEGGSIELSRSQVNDLPALLVATGLCESKGQARRLIEGGGVSINEERIKNDKQLLEAPLFLLSVGKKNKVIVRFVD